MFPRGRWDSVCISFNCHRYSLKLFYTLLWIFNSDLKPSLLVGSSKSSLVPPVEFSYNLLSIRIAKYTSHAVGDLTRIQYYSSHPCLNYFIVCCLIQINHFLYWWDWFSLPEFDICPASKLFYILLFNKSTT